MFTISFHAWRSGWIASQSSFVYHLRRSSESCFSWRKTSSASQCFQALIGRKLHGGVLFVFLTWPDIQCRLHFCFVCRYCADTLPWARGRPRPWMFFLLLHFFFLFSDYNFLHLPRAGILLHPLLSSCLFCSNNVTTASGGHRHSFLCLETFLVSPTFLHTPRLHFQA
jgi:hypothetical protein